MIATPVPMLLQRLIGKVFADQGYVSHKLAEQLLNSVGIQLITKQRAQHEKSVNAASRPIAPTQTLHHWVSDWPVEEHFLLLSILGIARSPSNFLVNLVCGLIAYCHQPKKPSLVLDVDLLPPA